MSRDRTQFTQGLDARAYAVKVGEQWFAGFGGDKDAPIVKLRKHLCDAKLMVSTERCADYMTRLAARGYPGAICHVIEVRLTQ